MRNEISVFCRFFDLYCGLWLFGLRSKRLVMTRCVKLELMLSREIWSDT